MDRVEEIRKQANNEAYKDFEFVIDKEDTEFLLSTIDKLRASQKALLEAVEPILIRLAELEAIHTPPKKTSTALTFPLATIRHLKEVAEKVREGKWKKN